MSRFECYALLVLVFAVARFFMPTHPLSTAGTYQALAHVFVGAMIGAGLRHPRQWSYLGMAGVLCAVEVLAVIFLR